MSGCRPYISVCKIPSCMWTFNITAMHCVDITTGVAVIKYLHPTNKQHNFGTPGTILRKVLQMLQRYHRRQPYTGTCIVSSLIIAIPSMQIWAGISLSTRDVTAPGSSKNRSLIRGRVCRHKSTRHFQTLQKQWILQKCQCMDRVRHWILN